MQEHLHLLRYPPQPEDREMVEEDEEADPLLEEEASDVEADGAESIPPAESWEDDADEDDEEEEPLVRKNSKKRRTTQLDEGASSQAPTGGAVPSSADHWWCLHSALCHRHARRRSMQPAGRWL